MGKEEKSRHCLTVRVMWRRFWDALSWLGLWRREATLVLVGLDNAGKTTLLHVLRDNTFIQHMPTQKPAMETFAAGALTFKTFDLGGHQTAQRLWTEYAISADALVFLVDAADRDRLEEARVALGNLLSAAPATVPVLVLGNKIDAPGAVPEETLRQALGLYGGGDTVDAHALGVFMCSVRLRTGFREGFRWLEQTLSSDSANV